MKKQQLQIQTFTPIYDEMEDRIRLIINYKDPNNRIDLMLTRAFIVKFIPLIEEYLLKNFTQEEKLKQEKNESEYTTKTEPMHIDSIVKEELLIQVDLSLVKDTQNILLVFITKTVEAKALVTKEMLEAFLDSLKISIPKYSWGIFF